MTKNYYKLTKISKTGYELVTSDIEMIYSMLDGFVCSSCKVKQCEAEKYCQENDIEDWERSHFIENAFPDDYDNLPTVEKVNWLMSTACGCEFMFEEFDSFEEYAKSEKEWFEEYLKTKENLI
ncbi:hypothetical protein VPIG_00053 [Vibrio phage PWH3a-P1]|uniref:hypothetical protein n=1 Tax=Vibrio phage PWH3a-P1 TaxID=754058 RepID=UPI0002C117B2|nr:hypothetical protein VPIG_00053 [Vibrio phage PWH3a-P1]AGH31911.1 hypothetical protein VPIG_00053 [Vibrio phage PWH3a-P1]